MSEHRCDADWLFGPLTPAVLERMRAEYQADARDALKRGGINLKQVRHDRSEMLSLLSPDRVTTAAEIGAVVGLTPEAVRSAIKRERERGAQIETVARGRTGGYRLAAREGAA